MIFFLMCCAEMNRTQSGKAQNLEKQFPGCLGRMANLLDFSHGVAGNRLLANKPHCDASSISRSRSDLTSMLSAPFGDQIVDKMNVSEFRKSSFNNTSNGTSMKTLIAREMSKEVDSRHNQPNVVAKLMGLDTIPHQTPKLAAEKGPSKAHSRRSLSHSEILIECQGQDHDFSDERTWYEGYQYDERNEYKDVYEMWHHSQNKNDRKMAVVRQKFMEAKRLAMDEKGRQSKEFHDALEVLSSNRDIFLEFLEEPSSMFSPCLYNTRSMPTPETTRITVLRPSKVVHDEKLSGLGNKDDKQTKKAAQIGRTTVSEKSNSGCSPTYVDRRFDQYPAQSTRIVVLKPNPGKTHNVEAVVSPPSSSSKGKGFYDESEYEETQESREAAKEIRRPMGRNPMGNQRDESLLSSVLSNGYIGDDSSFDISKHKYAVRNLSDSEIMSPTSRHSWDYLNRFGSPYSSSFSHVSCSPESSVCREAKKRLSERWASMTLSGSSQEQKNTQRRTSTLGEMLALSNVKKKARSQEEANNSPNSLLPSRSAAQFAVVSGSGCIVEVSDLAGKTEVSKELKQGKSAKSSLRGEVSSLFFSRNKKPDKEKCSVSESDHECQSTTPETPGSSTPPPGKVGEDASQCPDNRGLDGWSSLGLHRSSTNGSDLTGGATEQGLVFEEGPESTTKPAVPGNLGDNQDQPSSISVLVLPFEEDDNIRLNCQGAEVPVKSVLIDKSPPIESIARTLSWDNSCLETATSCSLKTSSTSTWHNKERDWPFFIQTLLSAAGLDGKMQLDSSSSWWHSPESPLDPALRNTYANLSDKELKNEAKRRQSRSNRKLVFDCVNAALMEITSCGSKASTMAMPCARVCNEFTQGISPMLVDHVWSQMKGSEVICSFEDSEDSCSLVVERVVQKEAARKWWADNMRSELDNLGKEVEDKLLAELVEDVVVDLTPFV